MERLAKQLGISRSGFYWHFKNRQDLLQHLLDYWAREYTGVITDHADMKCGAQPCVSSKPKLNDMLIPMASTHHGFVRDS
ncbi:MAG: TetR/AcrR family transcriptional regulator [Desulfosarcina sp.]|nr:TetR/AcrR family transcriptional regulator [Desulfosarcina sp.]MBC2745085.1 TetR/AcrR family transcriptional regulator [Desulfosarcina sp.]MBC2767992.1 TetR/AcrR family transcriptional regulator [Desulfosarcina sp.]